MMKYLALFAFIAIASAYVIPEDDHEEFLPAPEEYDPVGYEPLELEEHERYRRSFAPGAPQVPMPGGGNYPWSVGGNVEKSGKDTIATINAGHKTDQTKVTGTWSKVVRGPNKAKPNWGIGVEHRW